MYTKEQSLVILHEIYVTYINYTEISPSQFSKRNFFNKYISFWSTVQDYLEIVSDELYDAIYATDSSFTETLYNSYLSAPDLFYDLIGLYPDVFTTYVAENYDTQFWEANTLNILVQEYDKLLLDENPAIKEFLQAIFRYIDYFDYKIKTLADYYDVNKIDDDIFISIAKNIGLDVDDFYSQLPLYRKLMENVFSMYKNAGSLDGMRLFFRTLGYEPYIIEHWLQGGVYYDYNSMYTASSKMKYNSNYNITNLNWSDVQTVVDNLDDSKEFSVLESQYFYSFDTISSVNYRVIFNNITGNKTQFNSIEYLNNDLTGYPNNPDSTSFLLLRNKARDGVFSVGEIIPCYMTYYYYDIASQSYEPSGKLVIIKFYEVIEQITGVIDLQELYFNDENDRQKIIYNATWGFGEDLIIKIVVNNLAEYVDEAIGSPLSIFLNKSFNAKVDEWKSDYLEMMGVYGRDETKTTKSNVVSVLLRSIYKQSLTGDVLTMIKKNVNVIKPVHLLIIFKFIFNFVDIVFINNYDMDYERKLGLKEDVDEWDSGAIPTNKFLTIKDDEYISDSNKAHVAYMPYNWPEYDTKIWLNATVLSSTSNTLIINTPNGHLEDSFYTGMYIQILSGNSIGDAFEILNYDYETQTITIDGNWSAGLSAGDEFKIYEVGILDNVWSELSERLNFDYTKFGIDKYKPINIRDVAVVFEYQNGGIDNERLELESNIEKSLSSEQMIDFLYRPLLYDGIIDYGGNIIFFIENSDEINILFNNFIYKKTGVIYMPYITSLIDDYVAIANSNPDDTYKFWTDDITNVLDYFRTNEKPFNMVIYGWENDLAFIQELVDPTLTLAEFFQIPNFSGGFVKWDDAITITSFAYTDLGESVLEFEDVLGFIKVKFVFQSPDEFDRFVDSEFIAYVDLTSTEIDTFNTGFKFDGILLFNQGDYDYSGEYKFIDALEITQIP